MKQLFSGIGQKASQDALLKKSNRKDEHHINSRLSVYNSNLNTEWWSSSRASQEKIEKIKWNTENYFINPKEGRKKEGKGIDEHKHIKQLKLRVIYYQTG